MWWLVAVLAISALMIIDFIYVHKPPYIPKSQRNRTKRLAAQWLLVLRSWIKIPIHYCKTLYRHTVHRWKYAKYKATARRYANSSASYKTAVSLLAISAIAMSAEAGQIADRIIFDTDSEPIGIDNRCTATMSHRIEDFISELVPTDKIVKGFAGSQTGNVMRGTIKWKWEDDEGKVHKFIIPNSYYVPQGGVRLLSPQHWCRYVDKVNPDNKLAPVCETYGNRVSMRWGKQQFTKTVPLDPRTNVATMYLAPDYTKFHAFIAETNMSMEEEDYDPICHYHIIPDDDEDENVEYIKPQIRKVDFNLDGPTTSPTPVVIEDEEERQSSSTAAEFLKYHQKFGHISPKKIQVMACRGMLPRRLATCPIPVCTACMFGKATRRPWRTRSSDNSQETSLLTKPGECISVDQLISPTPGLIAQMTGFRTKQRYNAATVFVDQATGLGYVHLQKSTTAEETIQSKKAFEAFARSHGVTIHHYHADNGIFKTHLWADSCRTMHQALSFAGVGAHHQNGIAKRRIRELQDMARTMLIHAQRCWPSAITANLWPYAIRMANDSINMTPNLKSKDQNTPLELFSSTKVTTNPKHWHHFGCPVYMLSTPLQQAGGIQHKWKERSRVGIYLGRSPQHSRSVALVLDIETGFVSPQFHVKFDPTFQTLRNGNRPPASLWQQKCGFISGYETTSKSTETSNTTQISASSPSERPRHVTFMHTPSRIEPSEGDQAHTLPTEASLQREPPRDSTMTTVSVESPDPSPVSEPTDEPKEESQVQPCRSTRQRKPVQRLMMDAMQAELQEQDVPGEIFSFTAMFPDEQQAQLLDSNPLLAFAASNDPDVMYLHEAMRQPDKEQFLEAMKKEVEGQTKNGNWSIIPRREVPQSATVLPAVWAMRRKRRIDTREVYKWKARLNIDGSKQVKGINYWETYAPVATWPSIRLLMVHTLLHGWHTRQIDYVQAYPQADIEVDLYMEIPKGFEVQGSDPGEYVLKLHKNIYGQKQAGRVWNQHLVKRLKSIGFKPSTSDECVFYKGNAIYALYTDDSILAGPDPNELDCIIQEMKQANLDITVEGDLSDFLGVKISKKQDGTFHLTQPHLIESILKDLRLDGEDTKTKDIPAQSSKILTAHPDSPDFDNNFHYRSVIGKLNYLEKCTRPDISYAVHQCARFSANPKEEHGKAIKWLGRYLKGTADKGLIFKPDDSSFQVYVDSDFAGNWDKSTAHLDSATARSRYGYIITYACCPIVWASKMQQEIALSSTEAEFIGLSYALRTAIPIMELLKEFQKQGHQVTSVHPMVHCKVFEDNSGAIEIATVPKMRPRTKHINIKYHHFRSYIDKGKITIHAITTDQQPADMLTKPLNNATLTHHRYKVMGW